MTGKIGSHGFRTGNRMATFHTPGNGDCVLEVAACSMKNEGYTSAVASHGCGAEENVPNVRNDVIASQ